MASIALAAFLLCLSVVGGAANTVAITSDTVSEDGGSGSLSGLRPPSCQSCLYHSCHIIHRRTTRSQCENCLNCCGHPQRFDSCGCSTGQVLNYCKNVPIDPTPRRRTPPPIPRRRRVPPPPPPLPTWPTFASLAALQADPWAKYYKQVYGGLPTSFPVKTEDMWMVYDVELVYARVKNVAASIGTCPTTNPPLGQRYGVSNMYEAPGISWIWHPYPYQQVSPNSWAEVMHEADPFGDEHFGCWFMYAPGSGVYFNVGKTIAFAEHKDAFTHFGVKGNEDLSKAAAAQNFDSVQFLSHVDHVNYPCDTHNTGTAGLDYMGTEIVSTKLVGVYTCGSPVGAPPSAIKSGWKASKACLCDNRKQFLNCKGVPMLNNRTLFV